MHSFQAAARDRFDPMLSNELEVAIALAQRVGKRVLHYYASGFEIEEKIGADSFSEPVTIADREASRMIVETLARVFPDDAILSEEEHDDLAHRTSRDRVWIIDPIDGTAGFVNHDGDFAIQIGLAEKGRGVLGVVYLPYHNILTYASQGTGAFSSIGGADPEPLSTSDLIDPAAMTIAVSRNHPSKRMRQITEYFGFQNSVRRGSVGLKVSLIASRNADVYIHPSPRTKLWDTCAPQVILEEAGGRMTDLFGNVLTYDRVDVQNVNGIVASNGAVHDRLIGDLRPLLDEFGRIPQQYS